MKHNISYDATVLLPKAAELRANGASWEIAARDLGHDPEKLKELAANERPAWRRLLAGARRDVIEDAFAESVLALRTELRTGERKDACAAANTLTKLWMTLVRHRAVGRGKECKELHMTPDQKDVLKIYDDMQKMSNEDLNTMLGQDFRARALGPTPNDADGGDDPPPEGGDPVPRPPGPLPRSPVGGGGDLSPPAPRSEAERGGGSQRVIDRHSGAESRRRRRSSACRYGTSGRR
jgi:hypothetical protein